MSAPVSVPGGPTACPACGGALSPWRRVPASEPALGERTFILLRCAVCGSARTDGEPVSGLHDSGAYGPGAPRLSRVARPLLGTFDTQRLALLDRVLAPGARVLDAGAGRGRWVLAARARGYDAFGLEPSARGRAAAAAIGAPVEQGDIETATIEAGSLDAVSIWHVLEHLEEPDQALARLRAWLRPGGVVLVGVPNLASLQARLGGTRWFHLDVPRHRTHFTASGLRRLLERAGFTVTAEHHILLEHNAYGMWQSAVNRMTRRPSYLYNLLKRNAPFDGRDLAVTLLALPLVPVAALVEILAGAMRRGGTVAVVARRD